MTDPRRSLEGMSRERTLWTIVTRPYAWWVQWWWTDLLLALALTAILHQTDHVGTGVDVLGALKLTDRQATYTDALQMTAVFGGFSTVAFTIYLGLNSRSVRRIKVAAGKPLLKAWIASLVTPWVCAIVMVCCVVTDRGDSGSGNLTRWVAIAALVVVLLQMIRLVWIFYQLAIADLEESAPVKTVSDEELRVLKSASHQ
jgi:hypothetical protein